MSETTVPSVETAPSPPGGTESSLVEKLRAAQTETTEQRAQTNRVFISYSRHDGVFVRRLADTLGERGIDAWVDWEDIPKTAKWRDEIQGGVEASDNFIFVVSPASITSVPCRNEIEHASRYNKRIVPVVCESVNPTDCPPEIEQINWIFLRPDDDFEAGIGELIAALTTDLGWVRMHTHLLEQGIEWESKGHERSLLLRGASLRAAETWLSGARDKTPAPTALHAQYVLASRKAESARQRTLVIALAIGMAIALSLAIFALFQRQDAISKQHEAEQAQAQAVARAVTAEAASTFTQGLDGLETSTLLAIEAVHRIVAPQAVTTLRQDMALEAPIAWQQGHETSFVDPALDPVAPLAAEPGANDGLVSIRDAQSGKTVRTLVAAGSPIQQLMFGPHGHDLLVASGSTTVEIWRVGSWQRIAKLDGIRLAGYSFTPDGKFLVGQVNEGEFAGSKIAVPSGVKIWSVLNNFRLLIQFRSGSPVRAAAVSPGGRYVAAVGRRGGAPSLIVVADNFHRARPIALHSPGVITEMEFTPDGGDLITCACVLSRPQNTVYVWSTRTWKVIRTLPDTNAVADGFVVRFSPDGQTMARSYLPVHGTGDTLELWSMKTWTRSATLRWSVANHIDDFAFSPDGRFIAVASDNTLRVWTVQHPVEALRLFYPGSPTYAVQFGNGSSYLTAFFDSTGSHPIGVIQAWDVRHDGAEQIGSVLPTGATSQLVFTPDGREIESAERSAFGHQVDASIWDRSSRQEITQVNPSTIYCSDAFSPDGARFAVSVENAGIGIYDTTTRKRIQLLPVKACDETMAFNRGHTLLAASGLKAYKQFRIIDLKSGHVIYRGTYSTGVNQLALSPNGRYLAVDTGFLSTQAVYILSRDRGWKEVIRLPNASLLSDFSANGGYLAVSTGKFAVGSRSYGVEILSTDTWKPVATLAQDAQPSRAAFAADGSFIVTGQGDGIVRAWTANTGWQVATQFNLHSTISALAVSADGRFVAAGADDGRTRTWLWNPKALADAACTLVARNLTHTEWNLYVGSEPYQRTCAQLPAGP